VEFPREDSLSIDLGCEKLEVYEGNGRPFTGEIAIGAPLRLHVEFELREAIVISTRESILSIFTGR